jgi:hypothetical protein
MLRNARFGISAIALATVLALGDATGAQPEQVAWTQRLVDSVGVNTHLHFRDTSYVRRWDSLRDILIHSGIRHVRDGLIDTTWQPYYAHLNELGAAGIGATLITQWDQSPELLASYPSRVRKIDAYEAPNETDLSGTQDWPARLRSFQQTLWRAAKALPSALPVIGPSLTSAQAFTRLGDLSDFEDFGNMHDYTGGRNPETPGWGVRSIFSGTYGSVPYNQMIARYASSKHRVIATETGYFTDPSEKQGIPENIAGRYVPRLILEHFLLGVPRTFFYELVDEGGQPGKEGHFGLLGEDLREKPSFVALRSLLTAMEDPGPAFTPDAPAIDVRSGPADMRWKAFEKRTHVVIIALWRASSNYDVDKHAVLVVPPADASLSVRGVPAQDVTARVFNDRGILGPQTVVTKDGAAHVAVSDFVTLLRVQMPHTKIR